MVLHGQQQFACATSCPSRCRVVGNVNSAHHEVTLSIKSALDPCEDGGQWVAFVPLCIVGVLLALTWMTGVQKIRTQTQT